MNFQILLRIKPVHEAEWIHVMRQVLLDRHTATEKFGTSLYKLYQSIDRILNERYEVHRVDPMYRFFTPDARAEYLSRFLSCDAAVVGKVSTLAQLRDLGWNGKAILTALGSLPRGGAAIRRAMSVLQPQDVVLLSCTADMAIWNWFFKSAPRAKVIPFGVDTNVYKPMTGAEREGLRTKLGYSPEDKLILYCGRITVEKNFHSILPTLAELIREHPHYTLLIAGKFEQVPFRMFGLDVNIEEHVNSLVKELGIPKKNLRFLTHLNDDELVQVYNIADVLINLSLHHDENFGYSQVEAMACGTPVVANAWGGIKDTVKDNWSGYLIPTWVTASGIRFDRQLVKQRLLNILENEEQRRVLAENAVMWVQGEFSMNHFATQLWDVIEDEQLGPSDFKFSPKGLKYAWRFSQKQEEDAIMKLDAVPPRFTSYDDGDYVGVIENYTSQSVPPLRGESLCYRPSYWHHGKRMEDGRLVVVNDDPLWPHQSTLDGAEMEIVEFVYSNEVVPIHQLQEKWGTDCIETVEQLARKGYVSCSM